MSKRLTKLEIIDETVEFYKVNPRAVDKRMCVYKTSEGYQCAHSRCLKSSYRDKIMNFNKNTSGADEVIRELGFECGSEQGIIYKSEYQGHDENFWLDIQNLHDDEGNWVSPDGPGVGLTAYGKRYVRHLKNKYKEIV